MVKEDSADNEDLPQELKATGAAQSIGSDLISKLIAHSISSQKRSGKAPETFTLSLLSEYGKFSLEDLINVVCR